LPFESCVNTIHRLQLLLYLFPFPFRRTINPATFFGADNNNFAFNQNSFAFVLSDDLKQQIAVVFLL
jgi:hypothetical protein